MRTTHHEDKLLNYVYKQMKKKLGTGEYNKLMDMVDRNHPDYKKVYGQCCFSCRYCERYVLGDFPPDGWDYDRIKDAYICNQCLEKEMLNVRQDKKDLKQKKMNMITVLGKPENIARRVFDYVCKNGPLDLDKVSLDLNLRSRAIRDAMESLKKKGAINIKGFRYSLTKKYKEAMQW